MSEDKHIEKVCLMNMCMVRDDRGRVLALDKVNDRYTGTTFPGGHVEPHESMTDAIIREVFEESGLTIEAPTLCGLYQWERDDIRSVVFLYRADRFSGTLRSSEEGHVYWIDEKEYLSRPLAHGMEAVWQIVHEGTTQECLMRFDNGCRMEKTW